MAGALVLGLIAASCSWSNDDPVAVDPQPTPGTSSSQISADVPGDWQLVTAGVGASGQSWGSDTTGSIEPYTVVRRPDDDRTITVGVTGYEGYQGGLQQATLNALGKPDELTVDGRRALLSKGSKTWDQDPDLVDLVVDLDGSSAVRAQGIDASRDELIGLSTLAIIDADDHRVAPRFEELPAGFEVVGSVNATGVLAVQASLNPGTDFVPGDDRTHTLGWTVGPPDAASPRQTAVSVSSIPVDTISLDGLALALPGEGRKRRVDPTTVDGRPGLEITETLSGRWVNLTLVTDTGWGDQLVVTAEADLESGVAPPPFEQLTNVATSVGQADDATWGALVEEASGGPGLTPNVGRAEVARGKAGGIEWLLQTAGGASGELTPANIDECLKLKGGTSACPMNISGSSDGQNGVPLSMGIGELGPDGLRFAIMVVPAADPAVELRYTKDDTTITAPFQPVGGSDAKVSVLVAERGDRLDCPGPGDRPGLLERYDADGNPLGCLER